MKKKILGGIAAIAIATVVALNMQITVGENDQITDLSMANVEALAQYENPDDESHTCSATAKCFWGGREQGSVSCTGRNSCVSGYMYVRCDNHTSECV